MEKGPSNLLHIARMRWEQFSKNPDKAGASLVLPAHSRPKDGVATLAYDPGIHDETQRTVALRKHAVDEPHHGLPGQARQ